MEKQEQQETPKGMEAKKHAKVFCTVFTVIAGMWVGMAIFDICAGRYGRIGDHVNIAALCGLVAYLYHKAAYYIQIIMDQFEMIDMDHQVFGALNKAFEDFAEDLKDLENENPAES